MARNLTPKILAEHLFEGSLVPGEEIARRIDHNLLQAACARYGIRSHPAGGTLGYVKKVLAIR